MKPVRTRIAPSPTGDPHVGTAYIALFNRCFAKQHNGQFILRLEDTDRARSYTQSEHAIYQSLRWLGLDWDEGPDIGGKYAPYRQSERQTLYQTYCQQLLDQGDAFVCYRTAQELEQLRQARQENGQTAALKYSDLRLPDDEIARRRDNNDDYVVRMHVPESGTCVVRDELRGDITLDWSQVDAQILLKSDGWPTYHLANVVDDHLMQITHVIRGEEWINSLPKHVLLYQYFKWDAPQWFHLPLLRNPDRSKLSKRKNPTSIHYYRRMGYLPEAMVNYLGRMGWSMPNDEEKFTLEQMLAAFDIERVSLGGPIFDREKLSWLNGLWIRESLSDDALLQRFKSWALDGDVNIRSMIGSFKSRITLLSDIVPSASFLFAGMLPINEQDFTHGSALTVAEQVTILYYVWWTLAKIKDWHHSTLFKEIKHVSECSGYKLNVFLEPVFIAVSGSKRSISVIEAMQILGPDLAKARIFYAIEQLGGLSKKQLKALEKNYQSLPASQ